MTSEELQRLGEEQRHRSGIARKYSLSGEFLGEFLSLSLFDDSKGHPSGPIGESGRTFVRSLGDGIGFYSGMVGEWIEVDADGVLVRGVPLPRVMVQTMAVTGSGRVFAWISGRRFGTYELSPTAAEWFPVPGLVGTTDTRPPLGPLHGAKGAALAFQELPALPNLTFMNAPPTNPIAGSALAASPAVRSKAEPLFQDRPRRRGRRVRPTAGGGGGPRCIRSSGSKRFDIPAEQS